MSELEGKVYDLEVDVQDLKGIVESLERQFLQRNADVNGILQSQFAVTDEIKTDIARLQDEDIRLWDAIESKSSNY